MKSAQRPQSLLLGAITALAAVLWTASASAAVSPVVSAKVSETRSAHPKLKVSVVADVFVVASNGGNKVHRRARSVIAHAAKALNAEFFDRHTMTEPVVAFVLKNGWHYRRFVESHYGKGSFTGDNLGFYDPARRWLVMNHGPGPGTLAHELVHPLLATDYPDCPTWLNEGFASLLERKTYRDGRLAPRVNWRMRGLRPNLDAVSLKALMTTTTSEFYGDSAGLNYAAARHFLVWLRRQGHFRAFYKAMRDGKGADRHGITTLTSVTGKSLGELEAAWRAWVKKQRG